MSENEEKPRDYKAWYESERTRREKTWEAYYFLMNKMEIIKKEHEDTVLGEFCKLAIAKAQRIELD